MNKRLDQKIAVALSYWAAGTASAEIPEFTSSPEATSIEIGQPFTYEVEARFPGVGVPTDIVLGTDAPDWLSLEIS